METAVLVVSLLFMSESVWFGKSDIRLLDADNKYRTKSKQLSPAIIEAFRLFKDDDD